MKLTIRQSFQKDIERVPAAERRRLALLIDHFRDAIKLAEIPGCKKIIGSGNYYRVRLGNYRVGFHCQGDRIELIRILHRKEIYKYFP